MRKVSIVAILLGLFALPLMAQDRVEVFGGYQYLHTGNITINGIGEIPNSSLSFNGWDASAAYNFKKYLGVEGDFSGGYTSNDGVSYHVYTYTGGPIVSTHVGRIKPFAHALFGGVHLTESELFSFSHDGFTMMFGGGVDAKANRNIAIRLIQVDWLFYHFGNTFLTPADSQSNNVRIATGVVFRF